jgi:hypothetical protein
MFIRTSLLIIASLAMMSCSGGDDSTVSTTTSGTPDAATSVPEADIDGSGVAIPDLSPGETPIGPYYDGIYGLAVGECFNLRRTTSGVGIVDFVLSFPCDLGHENELFADTSYPADNNARYPGEDEVRAWALRYCYEEFNTFVGVPYEQSVYELRYDSPTPEYCEDEARCYRGGRCGGRGTGDDLSAGTAGASNR